MRLSSALHNSSGHEMVQHLINAAPGEAATHVRAALIHIATLAVTAPLTLGLGSLIGWHICLVRRVGICAMLL